LTVKADGCQIEAEKSPTPLNPVTSGKGCSGQFLAHTGVLRPLPDEQQRGLFSHSILSLFENSLFVSVIELGV
jgi:hypothetical protein